MNRFVKPPRKTSPTPNDVRVSGRIRPLHYAVKVNTSTNGTYRLMIARITAIATALSIAITISGCATTPPDRSFLVDAGNAIDQAAQAGAEDYSPLELRFARERLELAELQLDQEKPDQARRLADEAEIEAQLALARTRAAQTRAELAERQRELEQLRDNLVAEFGEEVLVP